MGYLIKSTIRRFICVLRDIIIVVYDIIYNYIIIIIILFIFIYVSILY